MATDIEPSLRASRGYVKAAITRVHNFVLDISEVEKSTVEALSTRRERLLAAFSEYEAFNMRILSIQPEDDEDVAAVEDKYLYSVAILSEAINRKTTCNDIKGHFSNITRSKTKLPAIEMPIFTGNYIEYIAFQALFTSLIHNDSTLDNIQKLYYLRSYLKNEPYDLIKNLPLTANSYDKARQLLEDRYNNRYRIINEHISQLLDLPALVKSTSDNIRNFVASLKQSIVALQNFDVKIETWDPIVICILNRKLDSYTAQSYQLERDAAEEHSVNNFIEYLEKRALALENAAPSTTAQYTKAKSCLSVNVIAAGTKTMSCRYCKCNSHKLFSCNFYVVDKITCKQPQAKPEISQLKLPPNIILADNQFNIPSEIDLLMGADIFFNVVIPNEYEPSQTRHLHRPLSNSDELTSRIINTRFGYIIGGSVLDHQRTPKQITVQSC
ncbi:uncharacterized protein LOC131855256 [Achroia grisella]|uniref:uncharacterized protein LOC131855256 n=1 Tax=Achroia grisella TaxID=688607 RepID=UPI0027D2DF75|nr:uncharacterized protein LOC131855256 [Achroia grisella]